MFEQIIADIKKGHICGSDNLAIGALRAFVSKKKELDKGCVFISTYLKNLDKSKKIIFDLISNDPAVQNVLNYVFDHDSLSQIKTLKDIQKEIDKRILKIQNHMERAHLEIARNGSLKIKEGMIVYTHGYSSTVLKILDDAKRKEFMVNVTEGKPSSNGKKMAEAIAKLGIPVNYYVDSAMRQAIKSSNIVLLGCEAASEGKFFNSIGSEMACEIAQFKKIPVYICTDCLKKINKFEFGNSEDNSRVWPNLPVPDKIVIQNLEYEKIEPILIQGVICDVGIIQPKEFFDLWFE